MSPSAAARPHSMMRGSRWDNVQLLSIAEDSAPGRRTVGPPTAGLALHFATLTVPFSKCHVFLARSASLLPAAQAWDSGRLRLEQMLFGDEHTNSDALAIRRQLFE